MSLALFISRNVIESWLITYLLDMQHVNEIVCDNKTSILIVNYAKEHGIRVRIVSHTQMEDHHCKMVIIKKRNMLWIRLHNLKHM